MSVVDRDSEICPACDGPKNLGVLTCSALCSKRLRTKVAGRQCKPQTFLHIMRVLERTSGPISSRGLRDGVYDFMGSYTPDSVALSGITKTMCNPVFIDIIDYPSRTRTFEMLGGSGLKDWMRPDLYAKMMSLEAESFAIEESEKHFKCRECGSKSTDYDVSDDEITVIHDIECVECGGKYNYEYCIHCCPCEDQAESFEAQEGACSSCTLYAQLDDCSDCGKSICQGCTSTNANLEITEFLCPTCAQYRSQFTDVEGHARFHRAEPTEAEITEAMISRIGRGGPIGLNQGAYDAEEEAEEIWERTCRECDKVQETNQDMAICYHCDTLIGKCCVVYNRCKCCETRPFCGSQCQYDAGYGSHDERESFAAESEFTCECKDHYNKEILFCPDCDGSMCPNTGACACRPTGEWFDYRNDPRTLWGYNHPSWAPSNRVCPRSGVPCNHREYPHPRMTCCDCGIGISVSRHRDSSGRCRNCVHEAETDLRESDTGKSPAKRKCVVCGHIQTSSTKKCNECKKKGVASYARKHDPSRKRNIKSLGDPTRSFSADDSKQGLIIPADGDPVSVEITGLEDMQAVVGGLIERVAGGDDWDLWGNEEALYMDLPVNEAARVITAWAHITDVDNIIPLYGDFLVLGINQRNGESKDLPKNIRDEILDLLKVMPPLCPDCGEPTKKQGYCKEDEKVCQGCCDHSTCTFYQIHEAEQCHICSGLSPENSERCIICFASLGSKMERSAEYTRISGDDMNTFLIDQGFEEIDHPRAHERVYDKLYGRGPEGGQLIIRVYTSIVKDEARDLGKDAIRVVPLYLHPTLGDFPMSRQKRVHRVLGWRNNLEKRIETAEASAPGPVLDSNGKPMRLRRNRKSGDYFWGSIDYPANTETKSYRGA